MIESRSYRSKNARSQRTAQSILATALCSEAPWDINRLHPFKVPIDGRRQLVVGRTGGTQANRLVPRGSEVLRVGRTEHDKADMLSKEFGDAFVPRHRASAAAPLTVSSVRHARIAAVRSRTGPPAVRQG